MDHPFHEMNYILYLFVIQCLKNTKKVAIITSLEKALPALKGKTGTWIV